MSSDPAGKKLYILGEIMIYNFKCENCGKPIEVAIGIKEYDKVQEQIKKELNISQEELKKLQKEFIEPRYEYTESEF